MTYFLLSLLYCAVTVIRNFLFDIGLFRAKKLSVPVISVGNITAGGSGKTPMVVLIGSILKARGKTFGVLSRGYGRKSVIPFFLRSGRDATADQIGDEPKMIGEKLGCPLGIGANRYRIGSVLIQKFGSMSLILDDAFSHRWLRRNLNLLVIDGANPWGKGMLPYGTRRETLSNVRRADAAVITRDTATHDDTAIRARLAKLKFCRPLFTAQRLPDGIVKPDGATASLDEFKDASFYLFSGIANGKRFEEFVRNCGLKVTGAVPYSDHYRLDEAEIAHIRKNAGASLLLTTEKDFYRLGPLAQGVHYIRIRLAVDQNAAFENLVLQSLL